MHGEAVPGTGLVRAPRLQLMPERTPAGPVVHGVRTNEQRGHAPDEIEEKPAVRGHKGGGG